MPPFQLAIIISLLIILITFVYGAFKGAPWIPTHKCDIKRFLKLANIKPGEKMIDLGCGDGRLIAEAVKLGAKAEGFEVSVVPYLLALVRRQKLNKEIRKNLKIHFKNFWKTDISNADIIYVFQTKKAHNELGVKFRKELKKGSRVITYVWPIDGWKEEKKDIMDGQPKLYLYKM